jgi:hypothetical protein
MAPVQVVQHSNLTRESSQESSALWRQRLDYYFSQIFFLWSSSPAGGRCVPASSGRKREFWALTVALTINSLNWAAGRDFVGVHSRVIKKDQALRFI